MRQIGITLALCVFAGPVAFVSADDKKPDNAKLIVGKWEATKADPGTLPVGSTVEFSAQGKVTFTAKEGGKEETIEGTYTVAADVVNFTAKLGGEEMKEKLKIK
jgi:uncharacterized protein (TIGR03066 family)